MGIHNCGDYSNPELDRLIEESAGIDHVGRRRQALESIMERLMEDLVWIPLYVDQDVYAVDRSLAWKPRNDSFILAAEIGLGGK